LADPPAGELHGVGRPLWLLRGRDRTGRNDFEVGFDKGAR
jgi:hypothetical protein